MLDEIRAAVSGFPFTITHMVEPTEQRASYYVIHDVKGNVWANCRNEDQARTIIKGLSMLATNWNATP